MPQKQKQDQPTAFKHWINDDVVKRMADSIAKVNKDFNFNEFIKVSKKLAPLELKARVKLLSETLNQHLPDSFPQALDALLKSLKHKQLKGFDLWPYTEFVQTYGLKHPQKSLEALYEMTQLFTSEFAVRPFLKQHMHEGLAYLLKCAHDNNVHVRRWSSEGSRPRLPWGERLDAFISDPTLTLPILEILKYDHELYVRKSVANHLNDIAKDNPKVVLETLKKWNKNCPKEHQDKILWITKQALRTLIKNGNVEALKLVGVSSSAKVKVSQLKLSSSKLKIGSALQFEFKIQSTDSKKQKIIVDYIVHHQKSGGKTSPKVFKLKTLELKPKESLMIHKKHSLKPVTTRKYYPGKHRLEIQVNGKVYLKQDWILKK
ncbi:DNA alkylation repair protein [bacterium]|nr:DNA alkylation repair protein [bacterium]